MNEKRKILITTSSFGKTGDRPVEMLVEAGIEYQLNPYGRKLKPEESLSLMGEIDGLIAGTERLDREILGQALRLKVISRVGTGLDSIDLAAAKELGITIFNTPDAHVEAVAELTLAGILDVFRHVSQAGRSIREGSWRKPMGRLLHGKVVAIVGLGRIGKALVRLLHPFDVTLLAYDPFPDEDFAGQFGIQYFPLDALLPSADVVTLHLPYSPDNYHLFDDRLLALMKPDSILVNCARGGLVDETALFSHLQSGKLAGAYLDTFEKEPYEGPLTTLDNVVLTPHIGSYAAECRLRMETEAVENLLRYFQEAEG